ncbi:MAG: hypothetical protein AVO35_09460 [Candidatus Aegiribacteria sp. MLS_C]|nr:MAG: hypothetical protein AVO35_09460 [Candidatus Aegiribacteria sp. MLS_C]
MNGTTGEARADLTGFTYGELREWVTERMGMRPFRADQVFGWIHRRRTGSFEGMTSISREARSELEERAYLTVLAPSAHLEAGDGTEKYSLDLSDGVTVESVLIPEPPRLTACLSTQAGCRCACIFCQTGRSGFVRDLRASEIVGQLYALQERSGERITNVVLMGMGEPMDNFGPVASALSIISDPRGICIGARKITVSTVGLPGGIEKLIGLGGQYGLALSLHSAVEETRRRLVPISAALPLPELRRDLELYNRAVGRRITLEYCLIEGINDTPDEAEALVRFSQGLQCKINLLLYNPVEGVDLLRPGEDRVRRFMEFLYPRCQAVTLRRSRGVDIAAACGQLGGVRRPQRGTASDL